MSHKPWYRLWFGEAYKAIYTHRDAAEAKRQVRFVIRVAGAAPNWRILDVGCGGGRHLQGFREQGFTRVIGIDLSKAMLQDARQVGCPVVRADMRHLPFRAGGFDLVASLFTSFGYFATSDEDMKTLAGFGACLKPAGYLFLDLPNRRHVIDHLVPRDERSIDSITLVQKRSVESHADGDQVVKRIEMRHPDGHTQSFEERVRLYGLERVESEARACGLHLVQAYGDECGQPYDAASSPRMALLFRRQAR